MIGRLRHGLTNIAVRTELFETWSFFSGISKTVDVRYLEVSFCDATIEKKQDGGLFHNVGI